MPEPTSATRRTDRGDQGPLPHKQDRTLAFGAPKATYGRSRDNAAAPFPRHRTRFGWQLNRPNPVAALHPCDCGVSDSAYLLGRQPPVEVVLQGCHPLIIFCGVQNPAFAL